MLAVAEKWLAARRLTDAPSTVDELELAVRVFGQWLGEHHPGITTFADVTREHCLDWISHIAEAPTQRTGKPLGVMSRIQRISGLSQFFRDTALLAVRRRARPHPHRCRRRTEVPAEGAAVHPRAGPRPADARHRRDRLPVPTGRPAGRPLVRSPPQRDPAPSAGLPGPLSRRHPAAPPVRPPTNCATARCRTRRSTASRPTSSRPNSAAASGSPPKAPASATST